LSLLLNSIGYLSFKVVSRGATRLERIVVMRTGDDIWSVSHDGRTISVHSTEEHALSAAFTLASERKQQGVDAVIVIESER
jgi:hypothetical protein